MPVAEGGSMSDSDQKLGEVDVVSFKRRIGRWPAGTTGTIVGDCGDYMMVEISNDRGETLDMPDVPVADLELVEKYPLEG
jgi:hypothetical protein